MKLGRDMRHDEKFCGGQDSAPPLSLALAHFLPIHQLPGRPAVPLFKANPFCFLNSAFACAELVPPAVRATGLLPGAPPRLTRGSVLSSVPAGVGCFPASADWG